MAVSSRLPWILKYRPRRVEDVVDQEQAKKLFIPWLKKWLSGTPPEKKAALFYGPAGVGKTSLVEAAANEYGLELIEMNASDFRRKEDIERVARVAAVQSGLFARRKIILLDEVDGISGTADRGGLDAILELIRITRHPIVMTANDPWSQRLRPLREAALMVPFNRLSEKHIVAVLKKICSMEGLECEDKALRLIAQRAEGDLRSAINDLQAVAEGYGRVTVDIVRMVVVSRDRQYSPWEMLRKLFMSKYAWQASRVVKHADVDYETLLQWINENIPIQLSDPEDVWRAYEALARADIMLARTKRNSAWELLSYVFDLAGPGVALSRRRSRFRWVRYQFPQRIALMAKTREVREVRNALAEALASRLLMSRRRVLTEVLPFLRIIFEERPDYAARIAVAYNLTDNMVRYLAGSRYAAVREHMDMLLRGAAAAPAGAPSYSARSAGLRKAMTGAGGSAASSRGRRRSGSSRRRRRGSGGSSGRQRTLF